MERIESSPRSMFRTRKPTTDCEHPKVRCRDAHGLPIMLFALDSTRRARGPSRATLVGRGAEVRRQQQAIALASKQHRAPRIEDRMCLDHRLLNSNSDAPLILRDVYL